MSRTVVDPYAQMAEIVETALKAEFDDLPYLVVRHDRIHESLGTDGHTYVGLSPDDQSESFGTDLVTDMLIQFYGPYQADVNPFQEVDPRDVTTKAERLRQALADVRTVGTGAVWFFDVVRTRFPNDATGNKTRFEMTVRGRGNNTGLLETVA